MEGFIRVEVNGIYSVEVTMRSASREEFRIQFDNLVKHIQADVRAHIEKEVSGGTATP